MHYWDTSTLAKLYVAEADSPQFVARLAATGPATTSELARWELFRVLVRKEAKKLIATGSAEVIFSQFETDVAAGRVTLLPMDAATEGQFRTLTLQLHRLSPPLLTRTLDAIHLATAKLHQADEVVVTDINLRKSAAALGLKVFP